MLEIKIKELTEVRKPTIHAYGVEAISDPSFISYDCNMKMHTISTGEVCCQSACPTVNMSTTSSLHTSCNCRNLDSPLLFLFICLCMIWLWPAASSSLVCGPVQFLHKVAGVPSTSSYMFAFKINSTQFFVVTMHTSLPAIVYMFDGFEARRHQNFDAQLTMHQWYIFPH